MRTALTGVSDVFVTDGTPEQLEVRISGRDRPERISVVEPGVSVHEELARFLNRQGPYAQIWIRLESGEYIRYDLIASVRIPTEPALGDRPVVRRRRL
jgi:hypothetical protein